MNLEFTKLVKESYRRAYLAKNGHYVAAKRSKFLNTLTGLPAIIINILLGSILFADLSVTIPTYIKWGGASLAFVGAFLGGIQTFFSYQRNFEGHRRIGRLFLEIESKYNFLYKKFTDGLMLLDEAYKELKTIDDEYISAIADAESFPTNDRDYIKSVEIFESKRRIEQDNKLLN